MAKLYSSVLYLKHKAYFSSVSELVLCLCVYQILGWNFSACGIGCTVFHQSCSWGFGTSWADEGWYKDPKKQFSNLLTHKQYIYCIPFLVYKSWYTRGNFQKSISGNNFWLECHTDLMDLCWSLTTTLVKNGKPYWLSIKQIGYQ